MEHATDRAAAAALQKKRDQLAVEHADVQVREQHAQWATLFRGGSRRLRWRFYTLFGLFLLSAGLSVAGVVYMYSMPGPWNASPLVYRAAFLLYGVASMGLLLIADTLDALAAAPDDATVTLLAWLDHVQQLTAPLPVQHTA